MTNEIRLTGLKDRLYRLKNENRNLSIGPCLSEKEVESIEEQFKITFPDEYRQLLLQVCSGFSDNDDYRTRTLIQELEVLRLSGNESRLSAVFPFDQREVVQCWNGMQQFRLAKKQGKPDYFISGNPNKFGVLKLYDGGPDGHYYLVLNGPQAGTIWESPDQDLWFATEIEVNGEIRQARIFDFYENRIKELEIETEPPKRKINIPPTQTTFGCIELALKEIPESVLISPQLTSLTLTGNKIQSFPSTLLNLINLQKLRICDNGLKQIPDVVLQMTWLKELSISGNKLRKLPVAFEVLSKLEVLHATDCELTDLPNSIAEIKTLRKLFLSHNKFSVLPAVLFTLAPQLQEIHLRGMNVESTAVKELQALNPSLKINH